MGPSPSLIERRIFCSVNHLRALALLTHTKSQNPNFYFYKAKKNLPNYSSSAILQFKAAPIFFPYIFFSSLFLPFPALPAAIPSFPVGSPTYPPSLSSLYHLSRKKKEKKLKRKSIGKKSKFSRVSVSSISKFSISSSLIDIGLLFI